MRQARLPRGRSRAFLRAVHLNVRQMTDDNRSTIILICVALSCVASYACVSWLYRRRAKAILENWAAANGFVITKMRQPYFTVPGPFKRWTRRPGQIICSFSVRDRVGVEQSGWALCGSSLAGVFTDKIEVTWDKPSALSPNQSTDPTFSSGSSGAGHQPRHS